MSKQKKLGRSNPAIVTLGVGVMTLYYKLFYGLTVDRSGVRDMKGPALLLAPHLCMHDPALMSVAVYPHRPNFVGSEHFLCNPLMRIVYKIMHVIPKKMFCNDAGTIRSILRAKREGNIVAIYPEGMLPCYAHSQHVTDGTADLIKKLGVDVYILTADGAFLSFPKWSRHSRHGKIHISVRRLFEGGSLKDIPIEEVRSRLDVAIAHDDELACEGVVFRSRHMAEGVHGILYKCPSCNEENTLRGEGCSITCSCGLHATLGNDYRLSGVPFTRINDWMAWQKSLLDPENGVLESHVRVGTPDEKGLLNADAGEGVARLDAKAFRFTGNLCGESVDIVIPTERIDGLPITVSEHFTLYYQNRMLYFYPEQPSQCAKWVLMIERTAEYRRAMRTTTEGATV